MNVAGTQLLGLSPLECGAISLGPTYLCCRVDPQELHSSAVFFSALQGRKQRLNDYIPVSRAGYGMQK